MRRQFLFLFGGLAVASLLIAACGGGEHKGSVSVDLTEFKIAPNTESANSGQVTFNVKNLGAIEHEFVILKTDLAPNALPVRNDNRADEDKAGTEVGEIESEELGPGKAASATFKLGPGKYVLLCNIPGHYAAGMATAFTVK